MSVYKKDFGTLMLDSGCIPFLIHPVSSIRHLVIKPVKEYLFRINGKNQ